MVFRALVGEVQKSLSRSFEANMTYTRSFTIHKPGRERTQPAHPNSPDDRGNRMFSGTTCVMEVAMEHLSTLADPSRETCWFRFGCLQRAAGDLVTLKFRLDYASPPGAALVWRGVVWRSG
ncbi:hypothetical protein Bbelb_123930 [Branchiostoma belcheri]|nr:hypothetical protein Bbelb_123930 [Branchiostoma belcheri]